jgi:hypothetical protein
VFQMSQDNMIPVTAFWTYFIPLKWKFHHVNYKDKWERTVKKSDRRD